MFNMEWVTELITKHTDKEGNFNQESFADDFKKEFPKHAVIKDDFNDKVNELKETKDTLDKLQKDHKDVEELQTTIADYEDRMDTLEKEKQEQSKQHQLESALKDAGGKDVDYLKFKLGDVELNKDGSIKDLDNKVKSLQENHPSFFASKDDKGGNDKNGFHVIDNKLNGGGGAPLTKEEIYKQYPKDKEKRIELLSKMEE